MLESLDEDYLVDSFAQDLYKIPDLNELSEGIQCSIMYDLVEEIWDSLDNNAYFDAEFIKFNYTKQDIDEFLNNELVLQYISERLIEIVNESDDNNFAIKAYGGLGSKFIKICRVL